MKMLVRKISMVAVVLIVGVAFISCKSNVKTQGEPVITNIIEKTATDYEGIRKEYLGKVLIVNFFASWCPPCREEAPAFTRVYNEYKDKNYIMVGFSIDEDKDAAIKFVNQYGFEFPVYMADRSMQKKYNVAKVPTTIIYSPEGELLDIIPGALSEGLLRSYAKLGETK